MKLRLVVLMQASRLVSGVLSVICARIAQRDGWGPVEKDLQTI